MRFPKSLVLAVLFFVFLGVCFGQESVWEQKNPVNNPPAREQFAIAYDSARGQVVIFGGYNGHELLNDTWVWDGTNWTEKLPSTVPPARNFHAMAYDAANQQVVMFGGSSGQGFFFEDTWVWDGVNWTEKFPDNIPLARDQHAMVYDPQQGQVVMFGGNIWNQGLTNDTWTWDGNDWIGLFPANSPAPRQGHFIYYDETLEKLVLMGGVTNTGVGDIWTWDGNEWARHTPTYFPDKHAPAIAYDKSTKQLLLFSGMNERNILSSDTLTWDSTDWTDVTPTSSMDSPPARVSSAMVYDPLRRQVVLFGGSANPYSNQELYNDTWVWTSNSEIPAPPVPTILVHGWCGEPASFGRMAELLEGEGVMVAPPFDYKNLTQVPSYGEVGVTIEDLATLLANHVNQILEDTGAQQVDIVAHSMGGLIARAWMSDMATVKVPYTGQIRKLIMIGTPNYGAELANLTLLNQLAVYVSGGEKACSETQMQQLQFGSEFISQLHDKWTKFQNEENSYRISDEKMLFIVGTRAYRTNFWECGIAQGCNDGLVDISSAVLPDTSDQMIRYIPYKHSDEGFGRFLFPLGQPGIVNIDNRNHETFQSVKQFLLDGTVPSQESLGYIPPHQRGVRSRMEGLFLARMIDSKTGQPVTARGEPYVFSFTGASTRSILSFGPNASGTEQINTDAGTVTAWGLTAPRSYRVQIKNRGYKPVTLLGVSIKVARPTVSDAISVEKEPPFYRGNGGWR